jgi:hypothetical protein
MKKRRSAEQIVGLRRQAGLGLGKRPNGPYVCRRLHSPDTFPTLEMCPYPLPNILFTTPFVHGLPVRDGRPSAFKASQTC